MNINRISLPGDISDEHGFLQGVENWSNHRVLLLLAIESTRGTSYPILEFGVSAETPVLHRYCESEGRPLVTIEESIVSAGKALDLRTDKHDVWCCAYDSAPIEGRLWSVAVIDHAPGERRWSDALRLKDRCQILVLHDTEPAAVGYGWRNVWPEFRWRVDVKTDGAWASAVSNSVDLTKWRDLRFGPYVVTTPDDERKLTENDWTAKMIERAITKDPEEVP